MWVQVQVQEREWELVQEFTEEDMQTYLASPLSVASPAFVTSPTFVACHTLVTCPASLHPLRCSSYTGK